jgi:hypothetical protein
MNWNLIGLKVFLAIIIIWYLYRIFRATPYVKRSVYAMYVHFRNRNKEVKE